MAKQANTKRKAIWIVEDDQIIQKRPRICDRRKFKPFWNSAEEAKEAFPRKAIWFIEKGEIVQKRPRTCDHHEYEPYWTSRKEADAALTLDFTITKSSLSIFYSGESHTVTASDSRYLKLRAACKKDDVGTIIKLMNLVSVMETETTKFKVKGSKLMLDGEELPSGFSETVAKALKEGNAAVLEKFWKRLKKNPDVRVRENLYKFLSYVGMGLSEDGYIFGYKYVNEDFTDQHTGELDYSPGKIVKMKREGCNSNPSEGCSSGLHVGTWGYSGGYATVLLIKVDPKDVVSVPNHYDHQKMRCCKVTSVRTVTKPFSDVVVTKEQMAAA